MTDLTWLLFAAAILLVLLLRIRRLFGRHRLSVPGLLLRGAAFGALALALVLLPSSSLMARAIGVALGAGLALGGVLATRIERVDADLFYRPNPVFGMIVLALLIGRLAERLMMARGLLRVLDETVPVDRFVVDPLGRSLIIAALSYYTFFYLGVAVRSRDF